MIEKNAEKVSTYALARINTLRGALKRQSLVIDPDLSKIALEKAKNMAQYEYIGHWTPA